MKMEEVVPRWGARSSKPGGAVKRSLVGSTPALFRQPPWQPQNGFEVLQRTFSGLAVACLACRPNAIVSTDLSQEKLLHSRNATSSVTVVNPGCTLLACHLTDPIQNY